MTSCAARWPSRCPPQPAPTKPMRTSDLERQRRARPRWRRAPHGQRGSTARRQAHQRGGRQLQRHDGGVSRRGKSRVRGLAHSRARAKPAISMAREAPVSAGAEFDCRRARRGAPQARSRSRPTDWSVSTRSSTPPAPWGTRTGCSPPATSTSTSRSAMARDATYVSTSRAFRSCTRRGSRFRRSVQSASRVSCSPISACRIAAASNSPSPTISTSRPTTTWRSRRGC